MAAKQTAVGLRITSAHGMMAALIAILVLLTSHIQLFAQSRTATISLELRVSPEELLQVKDGSVRLKIRLAPGTIASVWAANSCSSPSPQSQVISASGTYTLSLHTMMAGISIANASAAHVCLASSDGTLNDSVPVGILAIGNGTAVQDRTSQLAPNGVTAVAPAGWSLTTQADTTTWSNP